MKYRLGKRKSSTKPFYFVTPTALLKPGDPRKWFYFGSEEDGKAFLKKVAAEGRVAVYTDQPVTGTAKADIDEELFALFQEVLREVDFDRQAFRDVCRIYKQQNTKCKMTVRQAVDAFAAERTNEKSVRTVTGESHRLTKLIAAFEWRELSDITEGELRDWLKNLRRGDGKKLKSIYVFKTVKTFFGWCKDNGLLVVDPAASLKPKLFGRRGAKKGIYTPEVFGRMLRIAAGLEAPRIGEKLTDRFLPLLGYFALAGFCGLRTCEIARYKKSDDAIQWPDLIPYAHVRESVAKPTSRQSGNKRNVYSEHYVAALGAWLALTPRINEFIFPYTSKTLNNLKSAFAAATGIKWTDNGLRNSFASYALVYNSIREDGTLNPDPIGLGRLALEMGNSEAIARRYYAETLPPGSGKDWFGLRPPTPANVIEIKEAA